MTRLVLLPRAEDSLNDWHQSEDFFSPNGGQIRANLAPSKRLSVNGIPSPWAARDFMKWRLEDQKSDAGKEAVRIFQTLTLLQFLRLIEGTEVRLVAGTDGAGRLAKVLLRPRHDPDKKITIWKSNLPELQKYPVVAGSVASCAFFPAAGVNASDLYAALVNSVGPGSSRPIVDKDGNVTDADVAGALAAYLERLTSDLERARKGPSDSINALKTWAQTLARFGTAAQPNNQLPINLGESDGAAIRLEAYSGTSAWNCRTCQKEGTLWLNHQSDDPRGVVLVSIAGCEVSCPAHPNELIRSNGGAGDPLSYADFGCHPADQLYIWNESAAFPTNRTAPSQVGKDFIEHQFNLVRIRIEGRLIKLDDVILDPDSVAWPSRRVMRSPDGHETKEPPTPVDVPVLGEYACLVKDCRLDSPRNRQWILLLHGYPGEVKRNSSSTPPQAKLWETSTILVWPPQDLEKWAIDYIVASAPRSQILRFRIISQNSARGQFNVSDERMLLGLYRTESAKIRYIELGEISSGRYKPMGLMKVKRPQVSPTVGPRAEVVIDFGTSNSAILWKMTDRQPRFFRSGIEESVLPASVCQVTYSPADRAELERAASILLSYYPEQQSQPFVPALLAEPDSEHTNGQPCIPPQKEGVAILRQSGRDLGTSRVQVELKWRDWSDNQTRIRVRNLLEASLIPAFWDLCVNGVQDWTLKVTYPLAFETDKFDRKAIYGGIVSDLLDRLCRPGLTVPRPKNLAFFSESLAGAASLKKPNSAFEVTLDLGGGTLDVAIMVGAAGADLCQLPQGEVVAADSLVYGGRDFLRAIVTAYGTYLPLDAPTGGDVPPEHLAAVKLEQLESVLHSGGVAGLVETLKQADLDSGGLSDQERKWRWDALLAGISLYITRLLEGVISEHLKKDGTETTQPTITVGFCLLGQGWELLRLRQQNADVRTLMEGILTRVCAAASLTTGIKIQKPIVQVPTGDVDAKTAVVFGGLTLPTSDSVEPSSSVVHTADTGDVRLTFLGMRLGAGGDSIAPAMSLKRLTKESRPKTSGDPGYDAVLEDLWDQIPAPKGLEIKKWLLSSKSFHEANTAQESLILLGENSYLQNWPLGGRPRESLLGAFLSTVWRKVWAEYRLK